MSHSTSAPNTSPSTSKLGWLLIGLGTILRIVSFIFSVNSGGDAWARVGLTAQWMQHPTFKLIFDAYPPGHFWLIGLFSLVFPDVTFAGRFLSLVLGVASLYLIWKLTDELFGAWAGLFGLAVFVFYSLHIGYSTTSSAEVSCVFFLLLAMYFFFSYYTGSPGLWRLAVSGLALSAGESIRYEAWILCFGMGLICLWFALRPVDPASSIASRVSSVLAFAVTAGAWPISWMLYCWHRFGDPLYQITDTNRRVAILLSKQPHSHLYEVLLIPGVLLLGLSPFALAAAAFGVKQWSRSRATLAFVVLAIFFAVVQLSEIAKGDVVAVARYSMTLGALLAVLSGPGFVANSATASGPKPNLAHLRWSWSFSPSISELCWRLASSEIRSRRRWLQSPHACAIRTALPESAAIYAIIFRPRIG